MGFFFHGDGGNDGCSYDLGHTNTCTVWKMKDTWKK